MSKKKTILYSYLKHLCNFSSLQKKCDFIHSYTHVGVSYDLDQTYDSCDFCF